MCRKQCPLSALRALERLGLLELENRLNPPEQLAPPEPLEPPEQLAPLGQLEQPEPLAPLERLAADSGAFRERATPQSRPQRPERMPQGLRWSTSSLLHLSILQVRTSAPAQNPVLQQRHCARPQFMSSFHPAPARKAHKMEAASCAEMLGAVRSWS